MYRKDDVLREYEALVVGIEEARRARDSESSSPEARAEASRVLGELQVRLLHPVYAGLGLLGVR